MRAPVARVPCFVIAYCVQVCMAWRVRARVGWGAACGTVIARGWRYVRSVRCVFVHDLNWRMTRGGSGI